LRALSNSGILQVFMGITTKFSRGSIRRISAISLVALVFAQLTLAAYACPDLGTASGHGVAVGTQGTEPCAERDPAQPSMCHEHCKNQAALDHVELPGVAPVAPAILVLPRFDSVAASLSFRLSELTRARPTGPPPTLLFCVFLT
jgi:hypothetical protein